MQTRAAVLEEFKAPMVVQDLELDPPKANEVLVAVRACGLCHSDYTVLVGDVPVALPVVCGHEASGDVLEVGSGVTKVSVGDRVALIWIPACGHCRYCARGWEYLCNQGAGVLEGVQLDGTHRFHKADGTDVYQLTILGGFSRHTVVPEDSVVPIPDDVPYEVAGTIACRAATGWGAVVNRGGAQPGDTVAVFGIGGVGVAAIQGARIAGASYIYAIDILDSKLEKAVEFGATHTLNIGRLSREEVAEAIGEVTNGQGADVAVSCVDIQTTETIANAYAAIAKGGRCVLVAPANITLDEVRVPVTDLVFSNKAIQGCLYGSANFHDDMPRIIDLYRQGQFRIEEMITARYTIDEINEGYDDMVAGKNICGMLIHDH